MTDLDARPIRPHAFLGAFAPDDVSDPDILQVLERFQEVMDHFLGVQREVMLGYLSNGGAAAAADAFPASLPLRSPAPPAPAPPAPAPPAPAPPAPAPPAPAPPAATPTPRSPASAPASAGTPPPLSAAPASAGIEVSETLIRIVEARTGYPRDMLDLDLQMEADLGMDSIKRMEIIGTVCRTLAPDRPPDPQLVEALTRERTLGGLAQRLEGSLARSNTGSADRGDPDREGE